MNNSTIEAVLEDLTCRFIINVPAAELQCIERVIFQIEQAHWFYEDFIREVNPKLPSTSLKQFSLLLFQSCVLLRHWAPDHESAFNTFMEYKVKVPVCGCIILNSDMTKVLLVRGWKTNASWGFPKGKINQQETETSCAIREVLNTITKVFEEIGFDCSVYLREKEYVEARIHGQLIRLYIISGIDESVEFVTQTRKEIGWHSINSLPGFSKDKSVDPEDLNGTYTKNKKYKFYMVTPFILSIRKWINRFKEAKKKGSDRNKAGLRVLLDNLEADPEADLVGGFSNDYNSAIVPQNERVELEESLKSLLGLNTLSPQQDQQAYMDQQRYQQMQSQHHQMQTQHQQMQQMQPQQRQPQHQHMQPQHQQMQPPHQNMQHIQQMQPPQQYYEQFAPSTAMYQEQHAFDYVNQQHQSQYGNGQAVPNDLDEMLEQEKLAETDFDLLVNAPTKDKSDLLNLLMNKPNDVKRKKAEHSGLLDLSGSKPVRDRVEEEKDLLTSLLVSKPKEKKAELDVSDLLTNLLISKPKEVKRDRADKELLTNLLISTKKVEDKAEAEQLDLLNILTDNRPNLKPIKLARVLSSKKKEPPSLDSILLNEHKDEVQILKKIIKKKAKKAKDVASPQIQIMKRSETSETSQKSEGLLSMMRSNSQASADPGLELALQGRLPSPIIHMPVQDEGLRSALSGTFPTPPTLTRDRQSLVDILKGAPSPPTQERSFSRSASPGSRGSTVKEGNGLLELLIGGTGPQNSRRGVRSPLASPVPVLSPIAASPISALVSSISPTVTPALMSPLSSPPSTSVVSPRSGSVSPTSRNRQALQDILQGLPAPPVRNGETEMFGMETEERESDAPVVSPAVAKTKKSTLLDLLLGRKI